MSIYYVYDLVGYLSLLSLTVPKLAPKIGFVCCDGSTESAGRGA
jgi:hypothetical protein